MMAQAGSQYMKAVMPASEHLKAARQIEPNPLHPMPGQVADFVTELQNADRELALLLEQPLGMMPSAEMEAIRRKRNSIDAAISRQVMLAGRRMATDRAGSLATLNAIFKMGHAPEKPLDGRYRGYVPTPTFFPALDSFGRALAKLWLPWTGKRFIASTATGDNIFTPSGPKIGRLIWPTFSDYRPYKPGLTAAFIFHTYTGPGLKDPEVETLKLDYDNESNPKFLIRTVLDEVVQVTGDYYLGKAYLKKRDGDYMLGAFFALRTFGEG